MSVRLLIIIHNFTVNVLNYNNIQTMNCEIKIPGKKIT